MKGLMRTPSFAALAAVLYSAGALAQTSVHVDEPKIRAVLRGGSTAIVLPLENTTGQAAPVKISIAWLDQLDREIAGTDRDLDAAPGASTVELPLHIPNSSIWLRLRYSLEPANPRAFPPQKGVVAITQIAPYAFDLQTAHQTLVRPGGPFTVHAEAINPVTRAPVPGVRWTAVLKIGDSGLRPIRVDAREGGLTDFVFEIPVATGDDASGLAQIGVSAAVGDFENTETNSFQLSAYSSAQIQTDKPIYQPGQTMHIRAIVLDPQGKAAPGKKVQLTIENDPGDTVHTAFLTASRFGVVADDWGLPASAELGDYSIAISPPDDARPFARYQVRVSRYELPEFKVKATPDKSAYLPGDSARIEVHASYLFGKPVPHGHLKLVRIASGWNPDRKTDKTVAEGEAGADGSYTTVLDLKNDFEDLGVGAKFDDLHYAVFYTDPVSGRTEQQKFDVRISHEPIHVYVQERLRGGSLVPVYISTFYADGRPAEAQVTLTRGTVALTTRSNRFGVAKIEIAPQQEAQNAQVRAVDAAGAVGTASLFIYDPRAGLRVETERTLYRAGDPVTVRVTAAKGVAGPLLITAFAGNRAVGNRLTTLVDGKAETVFAYQPEFQGEVSFAAWAPSLPIDTFQGGEAQGARTAIYPEGGGLRLTLTPDKAVHRPGEKAALRFGVTDAAGAPVESVLGVAVVDQAVNERAQTDADFSGGSWFSCGSCNPGGEHLGSVSLDDLLHLDPSKPIPDGLDLAAEMLVARDAEFQDVSESDDLFRFKGFKTTFDQQMKRLKEALDAEYLNTLAFPHDQAGLNAAAGGVWFSLQDPWGTQYRAQFSVQRDSDVVEVISAGPDKTFDTADDFSIGALRRSYFLPLRQLIARALAQIENYPPTSAAFADLLAKNGLNLDEIRDPWGTRYRSRVTTAGPRRIVAIQSAGPDRQFGTRDDFLVATFSGPYFAHEHAAIAEALSAAPNLPQTEEEFRAAMLEAGIDLDAFRDPWGHAYRLTVQDTSSYEDVRRHTTIKIYGQAATDSAVLTPVTRHVKTFTLRSDGPDGKPGDYDDFDIANLPVLVSEESLAGETPPKAALAGGTGAIAGNVADVTGAAVGDATVTLIGQGSRVTTTDAAGKFRFEGIAAGQYSLQANVPGFRVFREDLIPVREGKTTVIEVQLQVGTASEAVTITATAPTLQTESSELLSISTPRVRDYFPETLLWVPELTTDRRGRAQLQFPLADSVTTWKVAAIASTLDGRIAEADADLRAFQPFFLEFSPPPVLTSGDRVELPVTVRNYLNAAQKVSVKFAANDWSKPESSAARTLSVAANASESTVYTLRATRAQDAARQDVTALAGKQRDAIEKSLRVHPDAQQTTQTLSDLVTGPRTFSLNIPTGAIADASRGELWLYPNLLTVLLESARGVLQSPHGCAEQTTSAGYSNLTALRYARAIGVTDPRIERIALENIRQTIDALPAFFDKNGGVRYWQDDSTPDIAVTAYVLNFLADVGSVTEVDRDWADALVRWLDLQRGSDGLWDKSLELTALVAGSLAGARRAGIEVPDDLIESAARQMVTAPDAGGDPYVLAQFLLASMDSASQPVLAGTAQRLAGMARDERGGLYWDLQHNTPFYGWGSAGRIETTAIAVDALAKWRARHTGPADLDPVIRRGLIFLLRSRDGYGSWYSSQATLRAMQAVTDAASSLGNLGGRGGSVDVRVNGTTVKAVPLPDDPRAADPVLVDVSQWLAPGENTVELIPASGVRAALMRLTVDQWIPWTKSQPHASDDLRLSVSFDHPRATAGAPIRCSVKAERVGFRGNGMILAEVGLPPAAEVDRASLESLHGVFRYDVLPDRVIFYLWPEAGGVSFDFSFRTRIAMDAKSEPSRLYDYYNPDDFIELPPTSFSINAGSAALQ